MSEAAAAAAVKTITTEDHDDHDATDRCYSYLITGANTGLGFEATRQLAMLPQTKHVFLACRSEDKAKVAIDKLYFECKVPPSCILQFCPFDASDSREQIQSKILSALSSTLSASTSSSSSSPSSIQKIHGIILNAGGMGHDASGLPQDPNGVLDIHQINILGHVHLIDALKPYLVPNQTVIVVSGSEVARGVPSLGSRSPTLPNDCEGFQSMLTGTAYRRFDAPREYSHTKAIAALYWAAWARRHPNMYVLTVSPGMTQGTSLGKHKSLPCIVRATFPILLAITGALGVAQPVKEGASRYVQALLRQGYFADISSGSFVAAANRKPSGPPSVDQGAIFLNIDIQNAAYDAVHSFL